MYLLTFFIARSVICMHAIVAVFLHRFCAVDGFPGLTVITLYGRSAECPSVMYLLVAGCGLSLQEIRILNSKFGDY